MSEDINEALREGISANDWTPGSWANTVGADDEWQPDIEPPRINDYAAFKKHKHYGKYFRPYRYVPFPAIVYHPVLGQTEAKSKEDVLKLGPEWTRFIPFWTHQIKGRKHIRTQDELDELGPGWIPCEFDQASKRWVERKDMTGKSHPAKSETQRLAEVVAQGLAAQKGSSFDAQAIASVVAAVMASMQKGESSTAPVEVQKAEVSEETERTALLELAEKNGIKVDGRWKNDRIKKELGL